MISFVKNNNHNIPSFLESADRFLQFLYELNILSFIEDIQDESFIRWCFRERSYSNVAPKVKTHLKYQIHYGFSKALNIGKPIARK